MARILITEDEANIAKTLALNLQLEGHQVTVCHNAMDALREANKNSVEFHLAILDVMLPDLDGFALCERLRQLRPGLAVLFLTARDQAQDRIRGLKLGAGDYLTKPFDLEELLLRVSNLLGRQTPPPRFQFVNGSIDFDTYEAVDRAGKTHTLSKREIGLLKLLTNNAGKVISRDEILETLWDEDDNASSRTIDNYVLTFRKLFEPNPKEPVHFHSVRGVGYRFTP